jgi:hypothetical protein
MIIDAWNCIPCTPSIDQFIHPSIHQIGSTALPVALLSSSVIAIYFSPASGISFIGAAGTFSFEDFGLCVNEDDESRYFVFFLFPRVWTGFDNWNMRYLSSRHVFGWNQQLLLCPRRFDHYSLSCLQYQERSFVCDN